MTLIDRIEGRDGEPKPAWRRQGEDWTYEIAAGEDLVRLGAVVWERGPGGRRQWLTVSSLLSHGPEAAPGLSAAKRRLETLWRDLAAPLAAEIIARASGESQAGPESTS